MDKQKRFFLAVLAVLLVGGLCGVCLGGGALTLVSRLVPKPPAVSAFTPGTTGTPLPYPSGTPTQSPVPTLPALTITAITPTQRLTATLSISGTQVISGTNLSPGIPSQVESTVVASSLPTQVIFVEPSITPAPLAKDAWCVPWNATSSQVRVLKVLDGVSIEVDLDGQVVPVRYIGVGLPDFQEDFSLWSRSLEANRKLVEGKTVLLVKDRSEYNADGQLLRYVIANGVFVNYAMIRDGYAIAESQLPDVQCDYPFQEAESLAYDSQVGLWSAAATPTRTFPPPTPTLSRVGDVQITYIRMKGQKWEEPNEFVEIYNNSNNPVQLKGWTLKDSDDHVFVFPDYVMVPGQYCRVYTNLYVSATCGFSFFNPAPIWDDEVECAYLKDSDGRLVSKLCYE